MENRLNLSSESESFEIRADNIVSKCGLCTSHKTTFEKIMMFYYLFFDRSNLLKAKSIFCGLWKDIEWKPPRVRRSYHCPRSITNDRDRLRKWWRYTPDRKKNSVVFEPDDICASDVSSNEETDSDNEFDVDAYIRELNDRYYAPGW